jgi:conjugal transfer/entry exclusion protein
VSSDSNVFAKTQELKKRFAEFGQLSDLIDKVITDVKTVNDLNKKVGGDDEIGKQYHEQVDKATKDLETLMSNIKDTVRQAGENGINLVADLDYAEDTAHDIMSSM